MLLHAHSTLETTTLIAIHALLKTSIWMLISLFISLQEAYEYGDSVPFNGDGGVHRHDPRDLDG